MLKNGLQGTNDVITEVVYKSINYQNSEIGMIVLVPKQGKYRLGLSKYNRITEILNNIPFNQKVGYDLAVQSSNSDIIITLPDLITKDNIIFRSKVMTERIFIILNRINPINVKVMGDIHNINKLKNEYLVSSLKVEVKNQQLIKDLRSIFRYSRLAKTIKKSLRKIQW